MLDACPYDESIRKQAKQLQRVNTSVTSGTILRERTNKLREYLNGDDEDDSKLLAMLRDTPTNVSSQPQFMELIEALGKKFSASSEISQFLDNDHPKLTVRGEVLKLLAKMHSHAGNHPSVMLYNVLAAYQSCLIVQKKLNALGTTAATLAENTDQKNVSSCLDFSHEIVTRSLLTQPLARPSMRV